MMAIHKIHIFKTMFLHVANNLFYRKGLRKREKAKPNGLS